MLQNFIILEPMIQTFSDIHFRALVLFPSVKVLLRGRISIVSMTIAEQNNFFHIIFHLILLIILINGTININSMSSLKYFQ